MSTLRDALVAAAHALADSLERSAPNRGTVAKRGGPSAAARALSEVLDEDGEMARALKKHFHYTMLWKYKTGRRRPALESATKMHELTFGRIQESQWYVPKRTTKPDASPAKRARRGG